MIQQFEMVAKAVGDGSRVRILKMLEGGELCVCQVTTVLDLAPATVSKHLSVLKLAGLVMQRKEGRWVYYRLADRALNPYALPLLETIRETLVEDPVIESDVERLERLRCIPVDVLCAEGAGALESRKTEPAVSGAET